MSEPALGTLARADKGPVKPPPVLDGDLGTVANEVAGWRGIIATAHWDLYDVSRVDGVDFYYGEQELGHIHLDGWVHIATNPALGRALVERGLCRPFPYAEGWVHEQVQRIGANAAIALFERNYERLTRAA